MLRSDTRVLERNTPSACEDAGEAPQNHGEKSQPLLHQEFIARPTLILIAKCSDEEAISSEMCRAVSL